MPFDFSILLFSSQCGFKIIFFFYNFRPVTRLIQKGFDSILLGHQLIQLGGLGSAVGSPSGVRGKPPATNASFVHFELENLMWWLRYSLFLCSVSWFWLIGGGGRSNPLNPPPLAASMHSPYFVVDKCYICKLIVVVVSGVQAVDITDPNAVCLLLLCIHLYFSLPHYLPRSCIRFEGALHESVPRQVRALHSCSQELVLGWHRHSRPRK